MWSSPFLMLCIWTVSSQAITYLKDHAMVKGIEGNAVVLPCKAKENPEIFADGKATWTKDDEDLATDGRFQILAGNQLRINHVEKEDAGEYKCEITAGDETTSAHSLLRVKGDPETPVDVKIDCTTKAAKHIAIVSWDINPIDSKAKNRLTKYKIRVVNKNNPRARQIQFQSADYPTQREIRLAPGAPYRFEVTAINDNGPSIPNKPDDVCEF